MILKNNYIIIFSAALLIFSCQSKSRISKDFNCSTSEFNNLEKVKDLKKLFAIEIPKSWNTNLYQDETQSSIFTGDTTKQLTETVLLDVTLIKNKIRFNEAFLLKQEQEHLSKNLIKVKVEELTFLNKPSLYMLFKGKKGKFNYQVCNTFIKVNNSNFILAKSEIYGDSLVNQRLCKALALIEKIKLYQE